MNASAAGAAAGPETQDPHSPGYAVEDREIELVLHRWQTALLANDAERIAGSYARQVERYFLQPNVNRAYVREYMRAQEAHGIALTAYDLSDVKITHVSEDEVEVRFVAGFTVRTPSGGKAGSTRTLLKLQPQEGDWKIFYERDFNS